MCPHEPQCPAATAPDHPAATVVASHPEQGWSLLCNGVVVFDDLGELLPGGGAVPPRRPSHSGRWEPDPGPMPARPGADHTRRPAAEVASARARENRAYVRALLRKNQPWFAAALELAAHELDQELADCPGAVPRPPASSILAPPAA
jgi:hypothetical protein